MSNRSHLQQRQRRRQGAARAQLRSLARTAARTQRSCVCDGAVDIRHDLHETLTVLVIHHSDDCPALSRQSLVYLPGSVVREASSSP